MAIDTGVYAVINSDSGRLSEKQQAELDDALAALIASTRRGTRKLHLLQISRKLAVARKYLGSLEAVGSAVELSSEMLRQFCRVETLSPRVKRLIRKHMLTSVDIADRISRLPKADQASVAEFVATGELDSGDVRAVLAHRKMLPHLHIEEVVRRVIKSRNVREYIVQFLLPKGIAPRSVRSRFMSFLGRDAIRSLDIGDSVGELCITERGKGCLESLAKSKRLSKRELVDLIVSAEVTCE